MLEYSGDPITDFNFLVLAGSPPSDDLNDEKYTLLSINMLNNIGSSLNEEEVSAGRTIRNFYIHIEAIAFIRMLALSIENDEPQLHKKFTNVELLSLIYNRIKAAMLLDQKKIDSEECFGFVVNHDICLK